MYPDEVDRIFRLVNNLMNQGFSGGYAIHQRCRCNDEFDNLEGVDIYEDDKCIYFTIELRGIADEDVNVIPNEDSIQIEVMFEGEWHKEIIKLPNKIIPESIETSFNNYILDIVMEKKNEPMQNVQEGNNRK